MEYVYFITYVLKGKIYNKQIKLKKLIEDIEDVEQLQNFLKYSDIRYLDYPISQFTITNFILLRVMKEVE